MKKKLKTLLSAFIAVCLMTAVFVSPISAADSDSEDKYISRKALLESLGILNFEIEDPEAPVSRGQFTDMAMRMYCKELPSYDKAVTFTDVIPNYEFKDAVEAAYARGIIQGMGSNVFGVDMMITPQAAVSVMLRILNYEEYIKGFGSYEENYLKIADRIKLIKGVDLSQPEISFRNAVQLMCNAADIAPLKVSGASSLEILYEKKDNTTLIYESLGVDQTKGIMTDSFYVSLDGASELGEDNVKINGEVYHAGTSGAEDYIGYNVKIYFDKDTRVIYYIEDDDTDVTMISDSAINDNGGVSLENGVLHYYTESGSRRTAVIGADAVIIYNGTLVRNGGFDESLFDVDSGSIRVIKDSYKGHTVVVIESYTDMVFDRYVENDDSYALINKFDSENGLIISDLERFSVKDTAGNTITLQDIPSESVISAAVAADGTSGKLIVNTEGSKLTQAYVTVGGENSVTLKTYNDPAHTYDEKEYEYSAAFERLNREKNIVKPSREYTVYISAFGRIAYMDLDKDMSDFYAYIIKVFPESEDPEAGLMLRIFTEDGKVSEYPLSDNVAIDGVNCKKKSNDEITAMLIGNDKEGDPAKFTKSRLSYISLTFDSEVRKIDTCPAETDEAEEDYSLYKDMREADNTLYKIDGGPYAYTPTIPGRKRYSSETKSFDTGILLSSSTKIMAIPRDSTEGDRFKIITTASLINDRLYEVKAYGKEDDQIVPDVVLFFYYSRYSPDIEKAEPNGNVRIANLPFERTYDAETGICTKCNEEVNPDSNEVETAVSITNIRTGTSTKYFTDDKELAGNVREGQLLRYYVLAGHLCYLEPLYSIPEKSFFEDNIRTIKWNNGAEYVKSYWIMHDGCYLSDNNGAAGTENPVYGVGRGVIIKKSSTHLSYVTYDNYLAGNISDKYFKSYMCSSTKVFKYNERGKELEIKNFSDLVSYDDSSIVNSEVVIITKNKTAIGIIAY